MKLYIKQKVFSWGDRFTIKDEQGNDRYYVEGEVFSWGNKLHVYNEQKLEVAFIKQKMMTWMPRYEVYINGVLQIAVVKKLTLFRQEYILEGSDWLVDGDYFAHNYTIYNGSEPIATIKKAWFTWGDSYEINISDGYNELLVVASALAIDCVIDASKS
ncbi:MAG: LURP-one-related family protein [Eubacteriales bacterium]|nr:LURP-one-related family protein [Eubacteriales bacterium]MDD4422211.1 LURP-one-related family protein [Eubacteriales bacterium]HBR32005.1 hypothetical protein [Clostridiales bacterium]